MNSQESDFFKFTTVSLNYLKHEYKKFIKIPTLLEIMNDDIISIVETYFNA